MDMEIREQSHTDQIERWARFVRDNPNWKKQFKKFSDAQIILARKAYEKLLKTEEGKKIKLLRKK
jgi:hypothetical protein